MARKARQRAESGMYYIEVVSDNKLIFIENDDYRKFLELLKKEAEDDFAEILAYSLFPEKIYLVVKEGLFGISELMRKVLPKYTVGYNIKYARSGKLFYDRFKSRPLESEESVLDAVRYVHRAPLENREKDGLQYEFSSYNFYAKGSESARGGTVMMLCEDSPHIFKTLMSQECRFASEAKKLTDEQIKELLRERLKGLSQEDLENLDEDDETALVTFLHGRGVSIRRIAMLFDVGKSEIERRLKAGRGEK